MDVRPVIIVGREDTVEAFQEALATRDLVASAADLGNVEAEIRRLNPAALVLVSLPGDASARMAGHLRRRFGSQFPIIVSLGRKDLKLRDKCLQSGAVDVAIEGAPDPVATSVDAAVHGWLRAAPLRDWQATLAVMRGHSPVSLQVTDIDPSGIGFIDEGVLEPDEAKPLSEAA